MPARRRDVAGHKERYGREHTALRRQWAERVEAGVVTCWRCRRIIQPGQPWDLGHDDTNPNAHMGPEHAACNRGAAARKLNAMKRGEWGVRASREW